MAPCCFRCRTLCATVLPRQTSNACPELFQHLAQMLHHVTPEGPWAVSFLADLTSFAKTSSSRLKTDSGTLVSGDVLHVNGSRAKKGKNRGSVNSLRV